MKPEPILRNIHRRKFSRDHHHGLLFCWKIRQGLKNRISAERIVQYVEYFRETHLTKHFTLEETCLFASLDDPKVNKALGEHKQINKLLSGLSGLSETQQNEVLTRIADLLEAHIRYEERDLFPFFEKNLEDQQLEIMENALNKEAIPLKDDFEDPFWSR